MIERTYELVDICRLMGEKEVCDVNMKVMLVDEGMVVEVYDLNGEQIGRGIMPKESLLGIAKQSQIASQFTKNLGFQF
tara:strand:+ start:437 stop:670 length:234 start_codon:yes stop_codon:yes gene_type:complete